MFSMRVTSKLKARCIPLKVSRKVLSRRVLKKTEAELLKETKALLDILKIQGLLSYRRIHVMPIQVGPRKFRPNRDMIGMEDIQVYLLHGRTLYWELKSETGRIRPEQILRAKELETLGHYHKFIRSIVDATNHLKQSGLSVFTLPVIK